MNCSAIQSDREYSIQQAKYQEILAMKDYLSITKGDSLQVKN